MPIKSVLKIMYIGTRICLGCHNKVEPTSVEEQINSFKFTREYELELHSFTHHASYVYKTL